MVDDDFSPDPWVLLLCFIGLSLKIIIIFFFIICVDEWNNQQPISKLHFLSYLKFEVISRLDTSLNKCIFPKICFFQPPEPLSKLFTHTKKNYIQLPKILRSAIASTFCPVIKNKESLGPLPSDFKHWRQRIAAVWLWGDTEKKKKRADDCAEIAERLF